MAPHVGPHVDAGVHGGHHGAPPRPVRLPVRVLRVVQRGEPTGGAAGADGRKHVAVATRCTHAFLFFPSLVFPSLTSHSFSTTNIFFCRRATQTKTRTRKKAGGKVERGVEAPGCPRGRQQWTCGGRRGRDTYNKS